MSGWKKKKVQTQKQALERLRPLVRSNVYSVLAQAGRGGGGSLAGTAGAVERIVKHFPESIPMDTEIKYSQADLKKAFDDGKLYGDDELELETKGRHTAFECWFEDIFEK